MRKIFFATLLLTGAVAVAVAQDYPPALPNACGPHGECAKGQACNNDTWTCQVDVTGFQSSVSNDLGTPPTPPPPTPPGPPSPRTPIPTVVASIALFAPERARTEDWNFAVLRSRPFTFD